MQTHTIGYAYPSSTLAHRLGRARQGCHYVTIGLRQRASRTTPFCTYSEALRHAQTLGTSPDRWSMDHPLNAHFLDRTPAAQRAA